MAREVCQLSPALVVSRYSEDQAHRPHQEIDSRRQVPGPRRVAASQTFEEKLWNYLQTAQYRNWAPLPGTSADAFAGQQPHGAMVKVYANRTAAGNPDQLPHGSIIIKENLGPDGKALMAVTLMYRVPNYDAANGDWYWAKYEPDGAVSQMNGMKIAGKVGMCVECHSSAGGNDYSFSNDR